MHSTVDTIISIGHSLLLTSYIIRSSHHVLCPPPCAVQVRLIGSVNKTTGFWAHQIQVNLLTSLPAAIRDQITMNANISTRKRALKKKEAESKAQ